MGSPLFQPMICVIGLGLVVVAVFIGVRARAATAAWQQHLPAPASADERQQRAAWARCLGISSGLAFFILLCGGLSFGLPNTQPRPELAGTWSRVTTRQTTAPQEQNGTLLLHADGTFLLHHLATLPLVDAEEIAFAQGTWSLEHTWRAWIVHVLIQEGAHASRALHFQYVEAGSTRLLCIESDHGNTCVAQEPP